MQLHAWPRHALTPTIRVRAVEVGDDMLRCGSAFFLNHGRREP